MITKAYRHIIWKRIQMRRDSYERKYALLFRSVLNKEFKKLADKVDSTNLGSQSVLSTITKEPVEKLFVDLYKNVGSAFAKYQYHASKSEMSGIEYKEINEDEVDIWYNYMINYAKTRVGDRIVSIAEETRKQAQKIIKDIIEQSTNEGWGADETARQIRKGLLKDGTVINQWRALRIARTEVVTASNIGTHLGAIELGKELGVEQEKYWITTYDSRTRDTHLGIEDQNPKAMDEGFRVGAYLMEMPGDPDAGPEEVINCRCGISYMIKQ